ncbi:MAG: ClpX C4-type zinc finger protein [Minicystis sp.]
MGWFSKSNPPPPPSPEPAPAEPPRAAAPAQLQCSFCGKSQKEVRKLIAGPNAYICDECIVLSKDIIDGDQESPAIEVPAPADLEIALDDHAVGQRAAKRALVAALRRHLLGSAQPGSDQRAPRVLLVGPSGSGKTTLGRALCAVTGLVAHHADVSRLSESGYVGEDVENLLGSLLMYAKQKTESARRGVLFLDGLEKLKAERPLSRSRDISGEGVQRELIRLLDGLDLAVPMWAHRRHPQAEVEHFTCRSLFVGAAARLDPLPPRASDRELRAALASAGLLPELLARFDRIVPLPLPDADTLLALLAHPRGPIAEASKVVASLGGSLEYTHTAMRALAEAAAASAEGAWLLNHIVDRQMEEIMTAPSPRRAWSVDEGRVRGLVAEALGIS